MDSFNRSFALVKESFEVLKKDKEMLLFPVISGIVGIGLLGFLIVSMFATSFFGDAGSILFYLVLFLYYLASYFTVIFFNTSLITCANIRMNGGDPKFSDGIKNAMKHIGKIFVWALISATVGLILRRLSERSGLIGKIVLGIIGMAWSLLTFFVVPVMIFENVSVTGAIKRSGELFKKTWGENVIAQFSMGLFFFLAGLLGLIPVAFGVFSTLASESLIPFILFSSLAFAYWLILGILSASLNGIFIAALYNYATKGVVPAGFSEESVKGAWKPKAGRI